MHINLDEHRPHVTLETQHGNQHVIPLSLIQDVAKGEYYPGVLGDDALGSIVKEWLRLKQQYEWTQKE